MCAWAKGQNNWFICGKQKFQKIGEYSLNIARMLNILHEKGKCNIIKNKWNVYKIFTKWP